jgi:ribosomal protein S18 acetylase RimI-like enzyme
MIVRRAIAGDEPILRALRLEAMSDAPEAFGSTYDREIARTAADWQRWVSTGATFIAEHAGMPKGIVAGTHDAADPAIAHLMAMWIHPDLRRSGAAGALVTAVLSWARETGARAVRLMVIQTNERARRCYENNGFLVTGNRSIRGRDGAIELEMERMLDRAVEFGPPGRLTDGGART